MLKAAPDSPMDYLTALAADPTAWAALLALIAMEVVLGIDNLIFIAILTNKLPPEHRQKARTIGIGLALIMRLALLGTVAIIVQLKTPIFSAFGHPFSWRDLILIAGGLFLVWKATKEIHHNVDPDPGPDMFDTRAAQLGFASAITQIILLDLVFSVDSIITAVGMTDDIPDVDGSPATPAEQFAALLQDPLHGQADGGVALPFALSAFENAQFSALLCDDRIDKIEVKLVGDYLGDKEAEVTLTRQGLAGVRRCDGADLPQWSAYVPYGFERAQLVIQAGVNDWGTAGPNAGFAAWPVHGEQWTLTIPPPELAPANLDLDLAHISDVILRLHHRAGTVAPAGQGTFTPSCG